MTEPLIDPEPGSISLRRGRSVWPAAVTASVIAWYAAVYLVIRPLTDAPVIDGWIYSHAVRLFAATGRLRFAGFTEAMPAAQVLYGAAWGGLFGAGEASLDLSVALLGAIGAILFYALLLRCGAGRAEAALATGLLVSNPCYLFLSFSFMTDVPFLVLTIAAMLAFAKAEPPSRRLWVCAALSVAAFMIRRSRRPRSPGSPSRRSSSICLRPGWTAKGCGARRADSCRSHSRPQPAQGSGYG